ncbi:MAG TPA: hypothetical protein VIR56_14610 [Solimonas sp.]
MMGLVVLCGVLLSACALLWLARHDPKRLRVLGRRHAAAALAPRRLAVLIALAPGLAMLLRADWAELMIWAGAVLAIGWLLTQTLAVRAR